MYKITRPQIYLVIFSALFLQGSFINHIALAGIKPDLLIIVVVFFGIFLGPAAGFESGFAAGLLKDIFAVDYFWINAAGLAAAGYIVGAINTQLSKDSKRAGFIFVFIFTIFALSFHYIALSLLSMSVPRNFRDFFAVYVFPTALYTGLVSIPVSALLIYIYSLKETEDYL